MTRFKIRQRLKNRLESTRLNWWRNLYTSGMDIAGNSSDILYKLGQALDITLTTGGCIFSGQSMGTDIANAVEDYTCQDYKCLTLDCFAATCDAAAFGFSLLPKNNVTGCFFAGFSGASKGARTIRDRCKEAGGLLGCK